MSHDPTQDIPPGQARLLLTPGPLTTAPATRRAMLRDWGSRDGDFIRLTREVLDRLVRIACLETRRAPLPGRPAATDAFVAVPVQGSGTFAVEATLATLIAPEERTLVLINGAYGRRIETILQRQRKRVVTLTWAEDVPVAPTDVARTLEREADITHVVMVHCETTSGILNPLADVARVCRAAGRALIVDAMSSFGALPLDAARLGLAAVIASSNKCLEGVPGLGFAVIRREELAGCAGNSASLSFDLYEQNQVLEATGQWRFTPPTHVLAALAEALAEHEAEGGVAGRFRRYAMNCRTLVEGMGRLGFVPLLPPALQAPIIVTFRMPAAPGFSFTEFYDALAARGFVIYPGKLTAAESFRMGCIGHLTPDDMARAVEAVAAVLRDMGVGDGRPREAAS